MIAHYLGPGGFGAYDCDLERHAFRRVDTHTDSILIPGFVDIHCHGAFGIDFMSADRSQLEVLCSKLRAVGYEGFLPTTVTAPPTDVARALGNLPDHSPNDSMVLGFHLEGPFISPRFPGAQPKGAILDPPVEPSEWDAILNDPRLRVITLAPERPGALALIQRLSSRGVRVSIGHTDATYEQAEAGFLAGADHATHTFNAMRPLHHREPGTVGYVLGNDEVYAELIYDRLHVCRGSAEILFRCKTLDRVVAVSDSTMASGLPAGSPLKMWNLDVVVGDREVRLVDGTLAGSGITLVDAFRNLYDDFGPEVAIHACCLNPRRSIGIESRPRLYVELNRNLEIVDLHEVE